MDRDWSTWELSHLPWTNHLSSIFRFIYCLVNPEGFPIPRRFTSVSVPKGFTIFLTIMNFFLPWRVVGKGLLQVPPPAEAGLVSIRKRNFSVVTHRCEICSPEKPASLRLQAFRKCVKAVAGAILPSYLSVCLFGFKICLSSLPRKPQVEKRIKYLAI